MGMMEVWHGAMMGQPHQVTVSGAFVHFVTDMAAPLIITGTGNITICGKNLYDVSAYPLGDGYYINGATGAGSTSASLDVSGTNLFIPFKMVAGETVTLNHRPAGGNPGVAFYSDAIRDSYISGLRNASAPAGPWTFEVPNTANYIRFSTRKSESNIQIELGSYATTFEAFTSTTAAAGTARKSLVGVNNIWSDSGNITVTYWTH